MRCPWVIDTSDVTPPPVSWPVFSDDMLDEEAMLALAVDMSLADMNDE
jgi:hypothetical protein